MGTECWGDSDDEDLEDGDDWEEDGDDVEDDQCASEGASMIGDEPYVDERGNLWRSRSQYFSMLLDIDARMRGPVPLPGSENWEEWKEEQDENKMARALELRARATRGEHISDTDKAWYYQASGGKYPEPFEDDSHYNPGYENHQEMRRGCLAAFIILTAGMLSLACAGVGVLAALVSHLRAANASNVR